MTLCESLQRLQGRGNDEEIGVGELRGKHVVFHHEVSDSPPIQVINILMSVVPLGAKGKKQSLFRETQGTAVCQQPSNLGIGMSDATGSNERCNLFYCVNHSAKVGYFFFNSSTFNIVLSINALYSSE